MTSGSGRSRRRPPDRDALPHLSGQLPRLSVGRLRPRWTPDQVALLRQLAGYHTSMPTLCRKLGRSERSIRVFASRHGIALRLRRVDQSTLARAGDVSLARAAQLFK